jgi:hypothetical protein
MDFGLNEFRLDLLDYTKNHGELDKTPFGLHAVIPATSGYPPGVIYVLKNINGGVNTGQSHYEGKEARGEGFEEKTRKGIAISDLEKFVFDAKRRESS